jgi:4-hydroxybenzoate polyprenyltransferase
MAGVARLVQISRPRFWVYVAGTYAVGALVAIKTQGGGFSSVTPEMLAFFLYFLLPANLLIYGINDIFDYETDRLNVKKLEYEALVTPGEHRTIIEWIALLTAPFLVLLASAPLEAVVTFLAFLFFSIFYSARPIRAKTTPFLDCLVSSSIYVSSGVFGFLLTGGTGVNPVIVTAGLAWASAMHAYSAVPDIEADTRSATPTVATFLGRTPTLVFCAVMYAISAALTLEWLGPLGIVLGAFYIGLMIASMTVTDPEALFRFYKLFPKLNTLSGMAIFFWVLLQAL